MSRPRQEPSISRIRVQSVYRHVNRLSALDLMRMCGSKAFCHYAYTGTLNWALLEKPTVAQLPKKFQAFYGNLNFHYSIYNTRTLAPVLSQMNPAAHPSFLFL
jgi:hypothetical protein